MKSFNIPQNLNGSQLVDELIAANIDLPYDPIAYKNKKPPIINADLLWLDIADKDESKVAEIVKNHKGIDTVIELTITDKLARAGLSLDELKEALGL